MSRRHRRIDHAHVPVNPRYVEQWFGAVSVADAINSVFQATLDRAVHYGGHHGAVTIVLPARWQDCNQRMHLFLNERKRALQTFAQALGTRYNCVIYVDSAPRSRKYVQMHTIEKTSPAEASTESPAATRWRATDQVGEPSAIPRAKPLTRPLPSIT